MRALPILPDELPPVSPGEKLRTLPRAFQGSSTRADPGGSPWPAFVSFLALVIVAAVAGLSRNRTATTTVPTGGPRQAPAVASTPATAGTPTLFKKAYSFSTCPGLEALSFSPDGALLAGACPGTETTVFWSTGMGLETTLRGPEGFAAAVEFSPDSLSLATLARGGVVRLWDPRKGSRLQELRDSAENVSSPFPSWRSVLRFSPDGKLLAAAGNDLFVRLYTIPEGTIFRLGPLANPVVTMAFSPDGGTLAVATDSGPVDCFDPASGRFLRRLSGHDIGVESLAFSPDSELLAGAGWGRKTTIWEVHTGALRAEIREPGLPLFVDFSADGSRILTTSLDVPGFYWLDGRPVTSRGFGARKIWAPSYSRKAGRLVLSSAEHDVEVYEKEQTPVFLSPRPWPAAQTVHDTSCSAISPDGTRVATGYSSGSIKVWRLPRKL
jgi:WD40 repeat protein